MNNKSGELILRIQVSLLEELKIRNEHLTGFTSYEPVGLSLSAESVSHLTIFFSYNNQQIVCLVFFFQPNK